MMLYNCLSPIVISLSTIDLERNVEVVFDVVGLDVQVIDLDRRRYCIGADSTPAGVAPQRLSPLSVHIERPVTDHGQSGGGQQRHR